VHPAWCCRHPDNAARRTLLVHFNGGKIFHDGIGVVALANRFDKLLLNLLIQPISDSRQPEQREQRQPVAGAGGKRH
jgi:hypothetical protein